MEDEIILYVSHLKKYFDIPNGLGRNLGYVKAVDDVTFTAKKGETIGIVGETGCGKTTLGRTILQLTKATDGNVYFHLDQDIMKKAIELEEEYYSLTHKKEKSEEDKRRIKEVEDELIPFRKKYSLTKMKPKQIKEYRRYMQPVFQDPFSSLDPRKLIKDIIAEPMKLLTNMSKEEILEKEKEIINEIGLSEDHLYRFPHEFSGGQRQRIGIARAISIEPDLLLLDEPTSALDVSVQAQILNMLKDIQQRHNLTYLFISHHLNVIRSMSDRVIVMYLGKIVEIAETHTLFTEMLHPYTKALLSAIPVPDPDTKKQHIILEGEIPSPVNPPKGCYFHNRCPEAMRNCGWSPRDLSEPIRDAFDVFRNPEAEALPEISKIVVDEGNNILHVRFSSQVQDQQKVLSVVQSIVDKESLGKRGIMYKAIENITWESDGKSLAIKMIEPDVPKLVEAKKDHFVSCLLYESPVKEEIENAPNPGN
ncbi:ABC transport system ATP-binding protein P1P2A1A2 [Thermoplasma volcanium GSS1]|uniref:ABC transport system ATP-binding protein P1P2A1A2 n=1 Tax=Thermoplasma volcanium (strain ATCC 51530 / DSM 4299 / JCM 9571 / NBRC 15438 / GSS1) TaxID=273116 RepID=Q978R3_THEVO|nr:ABC transporter ATP-binding protein [Thermoplasma volcanium]BAB60494.1 ABC transport system ATP-binding protein P1P2A1A2 [Thermoplasma volcanium GSS1]